MENAVGSFSPYPQPGDVLDGKYRIERLLGEGGMGAVAKATHLLRRAPVALKFISGAILAMPGAIERFVNEGVAASQIDSDHVVKVFDVGRMPNGAPYLVMEFLDGRDLGQLLAREGPVGTPRAVHFCIQMLRALHTAHRADVVHRDMKPSNCFLIEKDGEPDFLKLVDFGISKVRSSEDGRPDLTRTNSALGTPLYMSPEQARSPRDVDHRTDLYSVGAILYELLCGRTPYTSETGEYTEVLFKIFTTEPEPIRTLRPDVPEGLAAVVHRALSRSRDTRFDSALDMADALIPYADGRSSDIIARIRAGRGRSGGVFDWRGPTLSVSSQVPASPSDPVPRSPFPTGSAAALRAPRVPTDIGLSLSAPGSATATRMAVVVGVVVVAVAITLFGAVVGMIRLTAKAPELAARATVAAPPPSSYASPRPLPVAPVELAPRSSAESLPALPASADPLLAAVKSTVDDGPSDAAGLPPRAASSVTAMATPPKAPPVDPRAGTLGGSSKASAHASAEPAPVLPKELGDLKLH